MNLETFFQGLPWRTRLKIIIRIKWMIWSGVDLINNLPDRKFDRLKRSILNPQNW